MITCVHVRVYAATACTSSIAGHLYTLSGPAHALKNACGQASSPIRFLFFGDLWADAACMLPHGLPVPAFTRKDEMSDRASALLCNPFYLVHDLAPWLLRAVL